MPQLEKSGSAHIPNQFYGYHVVLGTNFLTLTKYLISTYPDSDRARSNDEAKGGGAEMEKESRKVKKSRNVGSILMWADFSPIC